MVTIILSMGDSEGPEEVVSLSSLKSKRDRIRESVSANEFPTGRETGVITPRKFDVLLGRGQAHIHHPGNKRLAKLVEINFKRYDASNSRNEKTQITNDIVHQIKYCGTETGRFLRRKMLNGAMDWEEVDDETARLKVSQSLRYERRVPAAKLPSDEESSRNSGGTGSHVSVYSLQFDPARCNAHQQGEISRTTLVSDEAIWAAIGMHPDDLRDEMCRDDTCETDSQKQEAKEDDSNQDEED